MGAISRRLAGGLAKDVVLASMGSAIQRATPILLGALVIRIAGDEALHAHNIVYVAITLCGVVTSSGLAPHILRKRSIQGASNGVFAAESLGYIVLFLAFVTGYVLFAWQGAAIQLLPLAVAMFFYGRMLISLAVVQAQKRYPETLAFQIAFISITSLTAVTLLYLGVENSRVFMVAYLAGSIPIALYLLRSFPIVAFPRSGGLTRPDLREIGNYTLFGILGTGLTFLILDYIKPHVTIDRFNELIFSYQLYAFLIFIPSMLTVVVVPRSSAAGMNKSARIYHLPLFYGLAAAALVAPLVLLLSSLSRLYGVGIESGWSSLAAILLAAIPSSMIAGLNQINIVREQSHIPLLAAAAGAVVIVTLLVALVPAADFGYALLAGATTNFLVSAALTLLSRKPSQTAN